MTNKSFTESIARSLFSYYVWLHLFANIARKGEFNYPDSNKWTFDLSVINYPIPSPIEKYLSCIGNIKSKFGMNFTIDFQVWPNKQGHFGKVNKNTHYKYATMAAPVVLAQRIMDDLDYKQNTNGIKTWDLLDIAPDEKNSASQRKICLVGV